jgi:nuclear pore complex protein Nup205
LEAARLVFYAQEDELQSNLIYSVAHTFHDRRDLLLQSLRIILQFSLDVDSGLDDNQQELFQDVVAQILDTKDGPPSNGSIFARKCLESLQSLEEWHTTLAEQIQSREVLGQTNGSEIYSTLDYQKASVFKQHEALAVIVAYLFKSNRTISEDLRKLLEIAQKWNHLDLLVVHYMPAFSTAFAQHGSPDRATSLQDARSLDSAIQRLQPAHSIAALAPFFATLRLWWTAEYSGWYRPADPSSPQISQNANIDEETRRRLDSVDDAVKENALEHMLAICTTIVQDSWTHPARQELVSLLLSDSNVTHIESDQTSHFFTSTFMECLESFSEAWIFNLPDSIRKLKNEEDDKRLRHITAMQEGGSNLDRNSAGPLHLEALLVIISFAFGGRPEAADQFWSDADNGLHGFLVWASKRQTVPRVSAFCEMLCSISEGAECAAEAHHFLLDEAAPTSSKTRRTPTMNYYQMLSELELYSRKIHERPPASQMNRLRKVLATDMNETESPVMLASYLRLITHLCQQSRATRDFLQNQSLDFVQTLLTLSSGPVPSYLRASIFSTIRALLADKSFQLAANIWQKIDQWASCGHTCFSVAAAQAGQVPAPSMQTVQNTLASIASAFDQYDEFVQLLRELLTTSLDEVRIGHRMAFPEDLGATYRSPGISPYIDFVCGQLFAKQLGELPDEPQTQLFRFHCLEVIATCLETFNENYLTVEMRKSSTDASNPATSSIYAQRHPFARVMEWLLSEKVNANLMASSHVSSHTILIDEIASPSTWCLQRSIDILEMSLKYQPTFFDIVRPNLRLSNISSRVPISTNTCLEDGIISHPELISDLCFYAASENTSLVLKSVCLLQKLSTLRKLNPAPSGDGGKYSKSKRLIDMLGPNTNVELATVVQSLAASMQPTVRELEAGPEVSRYAIKRDILSFMQASLGSQRGIVNLAHLLLGFTRAGNLLVIEPDGLMERDATAFRSIIDIVHEYPDITDRTSSYWSIHMKMSAMQVLQELWSTSLSLDLTMVELRRHQFLQTQFISQSLASQDNIWDDCTLMAPAFWYTPAAEAFADFLTYRGCLYEYAIAEVKSSKESGLLSLQKAVMGTVLGKSQDMDGSQIAHASLLELFDFADLDIQKPVGSPETRYFNEIDFETWCSPADDEVSVQYDIGAIHETLQQCLIDLTNRDQSKTRPDEDWEFEAAQLVAFFEGQNRWVAVQSARSRTMHMWSEAVIAALCFALVEPAVRLQFILRTLEVILPKMDAALNEDPRETIELARVGDALLDAWSQLPASQMQGRVEANSLEKLFQLFRSCLEGISTPTSTPALRAILYTICSRYVGKITSSSQAHSKLRRNAMDCVRGAGMPLISVLSDDADEGDDECKLSSLELLSMLTSLSRSEKSTHVLECLVKVNALEIIIEPLKHIAVEFQDSEAKERAVLLETVQARLLLLLQISRTREGSGQLLDGGMLHAIRESMLFRADPDLGIDLDNAQALHNYYELVSLTLRLLVSTFVNRGVQNEQCQFLMRTFLLDHRPNMVGLFKRFNGVNGTISAESRPVLRDIVRAYTALASMTGFVEVC